MWCVLYTVWNIRSRHQRWKGEILAFELEALCLAGQENTQVWLLRASKFCPWASDKYGSLVVR